MSKAISIIGEVRWDSDYYQKHYLKNEKLIHGLPTMRFSELCYSIKKGIFDLSPENYIEQGIPFIRTSEIKKPTINFNSTVCISENVNLENSKTELLAGDLVFTKIGAYIGDVAMLPSKYEKYNFSQNVAGVLIKDKKDSAYLLAFFLSIEGKCQILRSAMLSGQGKLELDDIRNYEIPIISDSLKCKLNELLFLKQDLELKSFEKYSEAEQTLLEAVGLAEFKPSTQNTNIKTFAQSFGTSGRLDAEYYQMKYEVFESTVKSNKNGYTLIKNEYDHFNTVSRKSKAAYHYIEISDVNVSDGTNAPILIETSELPANAKFEVKKGDLIISKVRPNRGAITVIEADLDSLIVSGAFTILREKPSSLFTKEVLKVLLRTPVYREWMLQFNVGTQHPVIRDEDILDLPIPKIDLTTQTNISQLVQQSFSLKAQSEHLLSVAKRAVEIAIEQDEAAGIRFIENSTNKAFETHHFFEKN